jgi:hypothetical protein
MSSTLLSRDIRDAARQDVGSGQCDHDKSIGVAQTSAIKDCVTCHGTISRLSASSKVLKDADSGNGQCRPAMVRLSRFWQQPIDGAADLVADRSAAAAAQPMREYEILATTNPNAGHSAVTFALSISENTQFLS